MNWRAGVALVLVWLLFKKNNLLSKRALRELRVAITCSSKFDCTGDTTFPQLFLSVFIRQLLARPSATGTNDFSMFSATSKAASARGLVLLLPRTRRPPLHDCCGTIFVILL